MSFNLKKIINLKIKIYFHQHKKGPIFCYIPLVIIKVVHSNSFFLSPELSKRVVKYPTIKLKHSFIDFFDFFPLEYQTFNALFFSKVMQSQKSQKKSNHVLFRHNLLKIHVVFKGRKIKQK